MKWNLLTWVISTLYINTINGQECDNPVIRKEIRELSQNELTSYVNAVHKLHSTYQPQSPLSDFEVLSKLHDNSNNYIHHDPSFLPWHREFLFQYETKLRLIDPTIVLPYWDWTLDYEFPHESVVLSKYIMGSNGDLNNDNCLSNGPFANTVLNYASDQDPHCLRRSYNAGQNITAFMPPEVFITLTNEPKFSYFSFSLEVFHGYPHDGIGGDYGDFGTMYSPSDPLFYLHHGFIDMLFSKWQLKTNNTLIYEGERYKKSRAATDKLRSFNSTIKDAWDTKNTRYCYDYPSYPRAIPNPSYTQISMNSNSLPKKEKNHDNYKFMENIDDVINNTGNIVRDIVDDVKDKVNKRKNRFSKAASKLSGKKQAHLSNLLKTNPFFNQNENEADETEGKTLVDLTKHLNKKHGKGRRARKEVRKAKRISSKWVSKNKFSEEEVNEIHASAINLINSLNSIQDFVSVADAAKDANNILE